MTDSVKRPGNATIIAKYFGMTGQQAIREMKALSEEDKTQLADAIWDGSFTY